MYLLGGIFWYLNIIYIIYKYFFIFEKCLEYNIYEFYMKKFILLFVRNLLYFCIKKRGKKF